MEAFAVLFRAVPQRDGAVRAAGDGLRRRLRAVQVVRRAAGAHAGVVLGYSQYSQGYSQYSHGCSKYRDSAAAQVERLRYIKLTRHSRGDINTNAALTRSFDGRHNAHRHTRTHTPSHTHARTKRTHTHTHARARLPLRRARGDRPIAGRGGVRRRAAPDERDGDAAEAHRVSHYSGAGATAILVRGCKSCNGKCSEWLRCILLGGFAV